LGHAALIMKYLRVNKSDYNFRHRLLMLHSWIKTFEGWLSLSRPSFHTVGILPFILGTVLAYKIAGSFSAAIFALGACAIILIMLSTYHAGEYFDYREDEISHRYYRSKFAGGSGVIPGRKLSRAVPFWTSVISFVLAGILGIILQFYFQTGRFTLLLGGLGAFLGFFYSTKPIRFVERGIGEIFIGFCYGWLPVASAYYIQTATIHPIIHLISIPIGLTIFNVILLNEFPDYYADKCVGKKNLLYRAGKKAGLMIYTACAFSSSAAMLLSTLGGVPFKIMYFYLPVFIISMFIVVMIFRQKHEERKMLEILCGLNIVVNLGTSLSFILAYL